MPGRSNASLYLRTLRHLGHYRWFALATKHVMSKVDRIPYRATRGRLSLGGRDLPTILLTTLGRNTGQPRTVPVYFVRDGANLVVASENVGLDQASSWPRNLLSTPHAQVQIGAEVRDYGARLASTDEIERNMPRLVEIWPAHDTYLSRSGRRYVFVFEPRMPRYR